MRLPRRRSGADVSRPRSSSDRDFYAFPRLVKHVDDNFLAQLTQLYRQRLPPGGTVLELGASHISHLPDDVAYVRQRGAFDAPRAADARRAQTVVGTGLNAEEVRRGATRHGARLALSARRLSRSFLATRGSPSFSCAT